MRRIRPGPRRLLAVAAALAAGGCDITEVALAEPDELVVAEALVQVLPERIRVSVYLHPTMGDRDPERLSHARVYVSPEGRPAVPLLRVDPRNCLLAIPRDPVPGGACFVANHLPGDPGPGAHLELRIELPDGGRLGGTTTIPGDFTMVAPGVVSGRDGATCHLAPDTSLDLTWTRAEGAWAYFLESHIHGLPASLEPFETTTRDEPLFLVGLSVSAADTTSVFPTNLGVFDRFGSDSEMLVALQGGLPPGSHADVHVAAVDRNYVNWVRGGGFNPSGATRVPSLRGDGTGYFGSAVLRSFKVTTERTVPVPPACIAP